MRWRKCRSCLLLASFVLLCLVAVAPQVSARPQDEQQLALDEQLPTLDDDYEYDTDNVEFHQAKLVDGMLQEDHPVIMYKEDFVSEDYDPKKSRKLHGARKHAHRRRRIGDSKSDDDIAMNEDANEKYHALKPEKIYFDILSSAPIISSDESKDAAAGKLDTSKVHVEVISLADDTDVNNGVVPPTQSDEESKKVLLNKRPKKYHRRQRRDTDPATAAAATAESGSHTVQKRNPYLRYSKVSTNANSISDIYRPFPINYLPPPIAARFNSHPVPGDFYNGPISSLAVALGERFGGPNNSDRVIWRDYTPTKNPNQRLNVTRGTPAPLFPQRTTSAPPPPVTVRPSTVSRPLTTSRPTEQYPVDEPGSVYNPVGDESGVQGKFESSEQSLTSCVWAIAGCCSSRDNTVRYSCFERYGCNLIFWNLNPCAEQTRNNIVDYLNNQFD